MGNLLVRHLPADTIRMAKALAEKHSRSLQEEVSNMIVETVRFRSGQWSAKADQIRTRLSKKKKTYSDSTAQIREDRDR